MKVFTFPSEFRCYALDSNRVLHPHDVAVAGLRFKDGKAVIEKYAAEILENPDIVEFLAPLEFFEGYVTQVGEDMFYANIFSTSIQNDDGEYMGEFPRVVVHPGDWEKLADGVIFMMLVGHVVNAAGKKEIKVTIVLPPPYTQHDIDKMALAIEEFYATMIGFKHE